MEAPAIQCGHCSHILPPDFVRQEGITSCPSCGLPLRVRLFPAYRLSSAQSVAAQPIVSGDEASCFYHADKKAVVPCDSCGRFLCALCDCEIRGKHLCPSCLTKSADDKSGPGSLTREHILYDNIALILAIFPFFCFQLTLITAPASLIMSIICWNRQRGLLPRTKVRFIAAIFLSSLQIIGWIALITYVIVTKND